jgi:hypothetical protein
VAPSLANRHDAQQAGRDSTCAVLLASFNSYRPPDRNGFNGFAEISVYDSKAWLVGCSKEAAALK